MKKMFLVPIACLFTLGVMAQANQPADQKSPPATSEKREAVKNLECVGMKDGKMYMRNNDETTPMEKGVTTDNGIRVSTDGSYVTKDGTKGQLKNGECMDKQGNIIKASDMNKDIKEEKKGEKKEMKEEKKDEKKAAEAQPKN